MLLEYMKSCRLQLTLMRSRRLAPHHVAAAGVLHASLDPLGLEHADARVTLGLCDTYDYRCDYCCAHVHQLSRELMHDYV